MSKNYKKCRWSVPDSLEDYYCVNSACNNCTCVVSCDDDIHCSDCEHFYSEIESENIPNQDDECESLL